MVESVKVTFNTKCAKDLFYLGALVISTCDKLNLDSDFEFPQILGQVQVSLSGAGIKKLRKIAEKLIYDWEATNVS